MVTIKMVAQEAGVSMMTASRVLNDSPHVSEKSKKKVLEATQKLKYQPNQAARIMKGKRANIIGILIPDFTNPFYTEFISYIEKFIAPYDYHLLITSNNAITDQTDNIRYLISRSIDAIVICSYSEMKEGYEFIVKNYPKLPTVILDKVKVTGVVHSIYADGYSGIKMVVKHLIDIGHKKIGIIKGPSKFAVANERFLGYKDILEEYAIEYNEKWVYEGDYTLASGVLGAKYFLSLEDQPTAIVSITDYMAIGAMNYLIQQGYKIPQDFAITGYDGMYMGELLTPQLTTVLLPVEEMAKKAVEVMIDELEKNKSEHITAVYSGKLLARGSTN